MADQAGQGQPKWQFWIDRGGTFTDIGAPLTGAFSRARSCPRIPMPTRMPRSRASGASGLARGALLPADAIGSVKMGTTVATNALLERKGEATLLVITRGLRDQLEIGYQACPGHLRAPHRQARHALRPRR